VDLGGLKEAQVQSYSPGSASVYNFYRIRQVSPVYPTTVVICEKMVKLIDFAVWVVDSGGLKEVQVQPCSTGGANMPTWEGALAPPGEYD